MFFLKFCNYHTMFFCIFKNDPAYCAYSVYDTLVERRAACDPPGLLSVGEFLLPRAGSANPPSQPSRD